MNICLKTRRHIQLTSVNKLYTFFRCKFIIFSAPNKNTYKTVSYLMIRPTHEVSMHKHSYRHLNQNVPVCVI